MLVSASKMHWSSSSCCRNFKHNFRVYPRVTTMSILDGEGKKRKRTSKLLEVGKNKRRRKRSVGSLGEKIQVQKSIKEKNQENGETI